MDTRLTLTTWLTTMAVWVVALQAVAPGNAFSARHVSLQVLQLASEPLIGSDLADYQPPPDTSKPKDSSGAGGRS